MKKKKLRKENGFNLEKQYKDSWSYIKESKDFIYSIVAIFFVFVFIGLLVPIPESISKIIIEYIQELIEKTKNMSSLELTRFIFWNNLQNSFFGMILGIFFGVFPVLIAIVNGYVLGFVSLVTIQNESVWSLWRLLPHGIFELTAVFIALGLGLRLSSFILQRKNNMKFLWKNLVSSIKVLLLVIIPLLALAAVVEGVFIFLF
ncbi:MAG: stage II sporulation protein M [Nanoarchaeota archaeon]